MPYYRITIWIKNQSKPVSGIRFINETNIDLAQNLMQGKAKSHFPHNQVLDVEVAMLSKNSSVVKKHQQYILRKSGKLDN